MLCKVADADIVTDELLWQPVGTAGLLGPTAQRAPAPGTVSPPHDVGPTSSASSNGDENSSLKQRIAELEASRSVELEQARKGGFEQGLRQARQEAAAEMESALDRLAKAVQEVVQVKRKARTDAEHELVKLSLAIAKRILHRELTADPQSLRGVVYAALQRLQNREVTRVRVFPGGVPAVRAALERNGGMNAIEIVPDGQLQPGGLLFETALGELDASVETQLQEIERGFADKLQLR